jgi:hypothetical protein
MERKFKVKGPIFIGRSWAEYLRMFSLSREDLEKGKILDCAAGASSFTAHMAEEGYSVQAVDLLYSEEADVLCSKCEEHLKVLVESLGSTQQKFVWNFFSDLEDLRSHRNIACRDFIMDYRNHRSRYTASDIRNLPFRENEFSMVLCSHLLFIYDHRLDYDFHKRAVIEMLRVSSGEVRIYPIVKNRGEKSPFVKQLIDDLPDLYMDIVSVDYEFRKGGNEMLIVKK